MRAGIHSIIASFGILIFLFSCEEEKTLGHFTIEYPTSGQVVWNTIPVKLSLPPGFMGSIELRIDNQQVAAGASSAAPINWNSRNFSEGAHQLRAIATASSGETFEASAEIVVQNRLLELNVPAQHLQGGQQAFLFLSDSQGEIIQQIELHNGDHVILEGPETFNEPTFTVNEVYLNAPWYLQAFSIRGAKRGQWALNNANHFPGFVGSVQIQSTVPSSSVYYVSTSGDSDFLRNESDNIVLATTQNTGQLFVREVGNSVNKYQIIKNVQAGTTLNIATDAMQETLTQQQLTLPEPYQEGGRVRLYGFTEDEKFNEYYPLGVFFRHQQQITLEFPLNKFASIGSESYYRTRQVKLYSFHPRKLYDIALLNAEVKIDSPDGKSVDVATFGEFDVYATSWAFYDDVTKAGAAWIMIGPSGKSERLALPRLPDAIKRLVYQIKYDELYSSRTIQVSDYETKSYEEYLALVAREGISGPYRFGRPWKEQLFTESGFTSGRAKSKNDQMLVEMLKVTQ